MCCLYISLFFLYFNFYIVQMLACWLIICCILYLSAHSIIYFISFFFLEFI